MRACDDDELPDYEVPSLTVEIYERSVVAELLGPDGEPLLVILDRPTVPFGFQRSCA